MKRLALVLWLFLICCNSQDKKAEFREVVVERKDLRATVEATAVVEPQNEVSILPPVGGRVDRLLVAEGDSVRRGQELAILSSSDRAALLDAARKNDPQELQYWDKVFRPTPILAPVSGRVIDKNVVPGQTVNTGTVLFRLSDRLIYRAQVDESDIGQIRMGQAADIVIDAFHNQPHRATVFLLHQQAKLVSNVNIYEVELETDKMPVQARAGMTATATFIVKQHKDALSLPLWATGGRANTKIKLDVVQADSSIEARQVELGQNLESAVLIKSGLSQGERVRLVLPKRSRTSEKSSPFVPWRRKKKK